MYAASIAGPRLVSSGVLGLALQSTVGCQTVSPSHNRIMASWRSRARERPDDTCSDTLQSND